MENKYLLEHKDKLIKKLQLEIEETKKQMPFLEKLEVVV